MNVADSQGHGASIDTQRTRTVAITWHPTKYMFAYAGDDKESRQYEGVIRVVGCEVEFLAFEKKKVNILIFLLLCD